MVVEPSHKLKDVNSGISQVFAVTIREFFGAHGHDFTTSGLLLTSPSEEQMRLWAKLDMILQDGAAQKFVWGCKGDAGMRFCMLCKNVVSRASALSSHDSRDSSSSRPKL